MNAIRAEIRRILTDETHNARKALFETLIREVTINADDNVRPVFKLPFAGNDEGPTPDGLTLTDRDANQMVRALPTLVGDTGIEPVTSSVSRNDHGAMNWASTYSDLLEQSASVRGCPSLQIAVVTQLGTHAGASG